MNTFQIKAFLADTRHYLANMLRLLNMTEDALMTITVVADASYAWELLPTFADALQRQITEDPASVGELRALFLKVASVLDGPLMRINEARSPDLVSVSRYYSGRRGRSGCAYVKSLCVTANCICISYRRACGIYQGGAQCYSAAGIRIT